MEEKEQKEPPERSPERPGSEKVSPRRARPSAQRKAPTRSTPELDGVEAPEALRPGLGVRSSGGYWEAPETPVTPAVSSTAKPKPSANGARGAERPAELGPRARHRLPAGGERQAAGGGPERRERGPWRRDRRSCLPGGGSAGADSGAPDAPPLERPHRLTLNLNQKYV